MIEKFLLWYWFSMKRLLLKPSFVILLCLVPVLLPIGKATMSEDSGVLTVALSSENGDSVSENIISELTKKDSMIRFKKYEDNAVKAVENGDVEAAWIFKSDIGEKIDKYTSKKSVQPLVDVYVREDNISQKISREVLFEALYGNISQSLYRNYVKSEIAPNISESELNAFYNSERLRDIVEIKHLNSETPVAKSNYLTAPLRGFLSLLVLLCTLAAAMYFLEDEKNGKYDWLSLTHRTAPALALCLSSATLCSAAVFAALFVSGISAGFAAELVNIFMLAVSSSGFALIFCLIFRTPEKLGACLPGILVAGTVLSPIFFNLKILKPLRLLFPTHYYLYSVSDTRYMVWFAAYIAAVYTIAFIINLIKAQANSTKPIL